MNTENIDKEVEMKLINAEKQIEENKKIKASEVFDELQHKYHF